MKNIVRRKNKRKVKEMIYIRAVKTGGPACFGPTHSGFAGAG
jgi:hypothetical protein